MRLEPVTVEVDLRTSSGRAQRDESKDGQSLGGRSDVVQ